MKKTAFLCFLLPFLTGWGHQDPLVKVGLCLDHERGPLVAFLKKSMAENRADLLVEDALDDPQAQSRQAEELLQKGVQALVVFPCQGASGASLAASAHQAGIPVLALGRPCPGADYLIAFNQMKEGELEAQALVKKRPKGNYLLLKSNPGDASSQEAQDGWMRFLEPLIQKGDIRIVASLRAKSDKFPGMAQEMESLLAEGKKVDAVLASNAETAEGAVSALKRARLSGTVPVAGLGADLPTCRRIVSGTQALTLYDPPKKLAEEAAYLGAKLARKAKEFDCQFVQVDNGVGKIPAVLLTPVVLEGKNMESTIIQDKVWSGPEIYGK